MADAATKAGLAAARVEKELGRIQVRPVFLALPAAHVVYVARR